MPLKKKQFQQSWVISEYYYSFSIGFSEKELWKRPQSYFKLKHFFLPSSNKISNKQLNDIIIIEHT